MKLILRDSCFNGVKSELTKIKRGSKAELERVKQEIESYRLKRERAYYNAKFYFGGIL